VLGTASKGLRRGLTQWVQTREARTGLGAGGAMGARRRGTGQLGAAWEDLEEVEGTTGILEEREKILIRLKALRRRVD